MFVKQKTADEVLGSLVGSEMCIRDRLYTRPNRGQPGEMAAFLAAATALFGDAGQRPAGRLILSFRKEWLAEIKERLAEAGLPRGEVLLARPNRSVPYTPLTPPQTSPR